MSDPVPPTYLAKRDRTAEDLQFACVAYFARAVSPNLQVDEREIFDALSCMPDAMLYMLQSPAGWSSLVAEIAAKNGHSVPFYRPTRH